MLSTLKTMEPKVSHYVWDCHISSSSSFSDSVVFDDGLLAGTKHIMSLTMGYGHWFYLIFELVVPSYPNARFYIPEAKVQLIFDGEVKSEDPVEIVSSRKPSDGNVKDRLRGTLRSLSGEGSKLPSGLYLLRLLFTLELEKKAALVKDLTQVYASYASDSVEDKSVFSELMFRKAPDMKILCGKDEFHAHKDLLTEKSPVFRQMFENEMTEALSGKLVLDEKEIAPNSVLQLLRFLYTGKMEESKDVCRDLFVAAEKYDMHGLKERSENYLAKTLKPDDAMEFYDLAEIHKGKLLKAKALELLKSHKMKLFPNADAFQDFAIKYPQLMFHLFVN